MQTVTLILEIIGSLCFLGAMLEVRVSRLNLQATGLFLWALAVLLGGMPK